MTRKTLHDWSVRNRLRAVPGVSEINTWGGLTEQYHVVVDPQRLERFGVTVQQVIDALDANNRSFSGGFVERRSERTTVRGIGLLTGPADIEAVVITAVDGVPVLEGGCTPPFAAPECAQPGRVLGPAADVFSVGATLRWLLDGGPPERARPAAVSPALAGLLDACLAPRPSDRPPNARVLAQRLAELGR